MATINRPIDRQALYLTTITTAAGTVLLFRLLLLPPAAKLIPYCLAAFLQRHKHKEKLPEASYGA